MQKRFDTVLNRRGEPTSGAAVTVTVTATGAAATLFSDNVGTELPSNIILTDATGYYEYYAADGRYTEVISGTNFESKTVTGILFDDSNPSGAFVQAGAHAITRTQQDKAREWRSPADVGAALDGSTDGLQNLADSVTDASRGHILIPATADYLRVTGTWDINSTSFCVSGQGIGSMIVGDNDTGLPALKIGATHVQLRDFAVSCTADAGPAIEIDGGNYFDLSNLLLNWGGGDAALLITEGISGRITNVIIDNDSGYRPSGSGSDGLSDNGIYIPIHALGHNNNISLVNTIVNSGSFGQDGYSLKVGEPSSAGPRIGTFAMFGGLLQGARWRKEFFINASDAVLAGIHIENITISAWATGTAYTAGVVRTNGGVTYQCLIAHTSGTFATDLAAGKWEVSTAYIGYFEDCLNAELKNSVVTGGVKISHGCNTTGITSCRIDGVDISEDSTNIFVRDVIVSNNSTDPTRGRILDRSNLAELRNIFNASNALFAPGDNLRGRSTVAFNTRMETWLGGASPTVPCGLHKIGSPTITRDTSTKRSGSFSAKLVIADSAVDGLRFTINTVRHGLNGRWVCVEVWVYVVDSPNAAQLECTFTASGSSVAVTSFTNGRFERIIASFNVPSNETFLAFRIFGTTGCTMYLDSVSLRVEDYSPYLQGSLGTSATPSVVDGAVMVPSWVTTDTTAVTDFPDAHVGVAFTIFFAHSKTITYNANKIALDGSANFAGAAGDTLTLRRAADGIIYEVGRSVA